MLPAAQRFTDRLGDEVFDPAPLFDTEHA